MKYTLRNFMEDYEGFNWEKGKIVLVKDGVPYICTGSYRLILEKYLDNTLRNWTHDNEVMIVILGTEKSK